jgi:uncharacterized protein YecT (DUF1311 family)
MGDIIRSLPLWLFCVVGDVTPASVTAEVRQSQPDESDLQLASCLSRGMALRGSLGAGIDCYDAGIGRRDLVLAEVHRQVVANVPAEARQTVVIRQDSWRKRRESDCFQVARREEGGASNDTLLLAKSCLLDRINARIARLSKQLKRLPEAQR